MARRKHKGVAVVLLVLVSCVSLLLLVFLCFFVSSSFTRSSVFLCCYSSRGDKSFLFVPGSWVADVSALGEEVAIDNSKNNYATTHWREAERQSERVGGDKSSIMFETRSKDYEFL